MTRRRYFVVKTSNGYVGMWAASDANLSDNMPAQLAWTYDNEAEAAHVAERFGGMVQDMHEALGR